MKRLDTTLFIGPNLHSLRPLVRLEVDGEGAAPLSPDELGTRLQHIWPKPHPWPAMAECLTEFADRESSLHWAQAIGLVANFGQGMAPDSDLMYWHQSRGAESEQGETEKAVIYIEAKLPLAGQSSALFGLEVAQSLFSKTVPEEGERLEVELQRSFSRLVRRRQKKEYNNITQLLVDSALARGVPVSQYFLDSPIAVMGQGCHRQRMMECFGDSTSVIANSIARDKSFTADLLMNVGVPVPLQRRVRTRAELRQAVKEIGFPLVIKGRTGSKGDSVTTNIRSNDQIEAAIEKVRDIGQEVLVERHIEGEDFRLTIIDGKLVAAARRVPAHVIGDGKQSIAELIDEENLRRANLDSH